MESHILNTYHHARFRPIGHKILRMKSDSLSSESSCNQNSPEYPQISVPKQRHSVDSNGDWCQNQTINTTQSSQDTSTDDESSGLEENMVEENELQENADDSGEELCDSIEVHEINVDDDENIEVDDDNEILHSNSLDMRISRSNSIDDNTLIEGHDYDVITVYTVNPDLDLIEASSDEETDVDNVISEKEYIDVGECVNSVDNSNYRDDVNYEAPSTIISQDGLDINLDTPVVSNVDDYFIKSNNSAPYTDDLVVKDVDEYFIKDKGKDTTPVPNVDDFFIKHTLPEEESTQFHIPVPIPNVEEFLVTDIKKNTEEATEVENEQNNNADVSINVSDLEVLPNIEDLKRYLLSDMTYTKFRHIQKSCSVPQSPMQNICMDIDDVKTCMSFEDLNLDLSDLAFDNDKEKSESANKSDDIPTTLTDEEVNSFLITNKTNAKSDKIEQEEDDLSHQDMEIERPLEASIKNLSPIKDVSFRKRTSTPIPTVLDFCIEKTALKKESTSDSKGELDDFVDVESCNDSIIPVLEANNLNSLLEQFEATEKLNSKKKVLPEVKTEESKIKSFNKNALTNGMRLQDAGVQLNKNKMRQILMPPTPMNATITRSQSPVVSDHDYCSPKKRNSMPNLKRGQSLLKPEVLSSNSRILNSRHRSCKSKKVVYHLSSDEETDNSAKNKKVTKPNDIDVKKKTSVKTSVKSPVQSNCRKKLSPPHSTPDSFKHKSNSSVMIKSASKASDNCSQNSNGSIKLIIKNKSEVILNCDHIDSQKDRHKNIDKCNISVSEKTNYLGKQDRNINELDRNKDKVVNNAKTVTGKEEPRPKTENFYTALFSNKRDVQIPQAMQPKAVKRPVNEEPNKCMLEVAIKKENEQPLKKKKLNLQEYKLRRGVCSNNSSATVSPEAIFPDMPSPGLDKTVKCPKPQTLPNGLRNTTGKVNNEQKFFDPIKEASRKILMNTKKNKAEAMRKRDEDIVMSKIPKVQNLQLQPLISDAEMMKIVGMTQPEALPVPLVSDKPQLSADYEEIIRVSIGINTDENMHNLVQESVEKNKPASPTIDSKSLINFKIKKSDHVLKQNVFDNVKRDKRSPVEDKKHMDMKIDKERYKGISATLKFVGKQVETKISSNSLFASIQDVVMKQAPDELTEKTVDRHSKPRSPVEKRASKCLKTKIVREYDPKAEHGEDKVILHLGKHRSKPGSTSTIVQTDSVAEFPELPMLTNSSEVTLSRKRNDSDMSLSSDGSHISRKKDERHVKEAKPEERVAKPREARPERTETKEKRSRSKDRYESKYRRRSGSRSRRRRSRTRSRSKSRGRYRRYRRSDSPYKRKRRSRSPYHKRRSPSIKRDRCNRSRSRSRPAETRSKSPVAKKLKPSPPMNNSDRKPIKSTTPPLRKLTVSESSDSSTSSSSSSSTSSSSSSSSATSRKSRGSCSSYKRDEPYKKKEYRSSYSSEDRESNTPVEERRIVFVGRLEKDITKTALRNQFSQFGSVLEVRLHSKEDGSRYGFVTYQRARDAWAAVGAAALLPRYDVGFGGRRAFCRHTYADLDGLEAKYTESAFHGQAAPPIRRDDDMSFEQMLLEMKKKLNQRKNEMKRPDEPKP